MEGPFVILALFAVGVVLKRTAALPEDAPRTLNLYVIHVTVPAMILLRIPSLAFSKAMLVPALTPWVALAVSAALVAVFARVRRLDRGTTGALLMVVPLGNTSFLGFPMVTALMGEAALPHAVLYDQLGSFVAVVTYGSFVLARYGAGERPTARAIARRLVTFPPFVALVAALALRGVSYPRPVAAVLEAVAATLLPVIMVAVGLALDFRPEPGDASTLAFGLGVKMLVAPLAVFVLCRALGVWGDPARVSVLEAAMPPMVTGAALASAAGLAPRLAASMVGFGLLLSFVSLPVLARLLD